MLVTSKNHFFLSLLSKNHFFIIATMQTDIILYLNYVTLHKAHARARYVLLRVLMEAGDGLLIVKETEPGNNLLVSLDRSKISTVGMKAVKEFLLKLQVRNNVTFLQKYVNY